MRNPLLIHLHIFQLEGYSPSRFLKWWIQHPFKFKDENKLPLVWTNKARFIYACSYGFWPLMFLAILFLKPYEAWNRNRVKNATREKINLLKQTGLKVIGITGSYGKSSTKEILYQILKTKFRVLRTPESYNTLFGIANVVDLELDKNYDYFICEMGAYKRGEINELCEMVDPDYGMLTGINEQHLERFGSIENTIKAKFELPKYVLSKSGKVVANFGNDLVRENAKGVIGYGQKQYKHPLDQNTEGAIVMAKELGVSEMAVENIQPSEHRLSVTKRGGLTIIDDAYSSNVDGFKSAINYLKSFDGWKVIITPGITELGNKTASIHQELGKLLQGVDQVILVGKNVRTTNLELGFGGNATYIQSVGEAIEKVKREKAVVLFENDLPDNY